MINWNEKTKRILKSELVRQGVTHSQLADLLNQQGCKETKSSIDSKISRGSFSASFFLQSLSVIGCRKIELESLNSSWPLAAEPDEKYSP